jgi:hypothetical protein
MRRCIPLVIAVLAVFSGVASAARRSDGSRPATPHIAQLVTGVPASTLNQVGAGDILGRPQFDVRKLSGGPLTSAGKPELLTANLAWCPHCAANSWALAVAVSRFGKLTGLRRIDTGTLFGSKFHANPSYPHTQGLSFFKARYTSNYLAFGAVVVQDLEGRRLQQPTPAQGRAIQSFDSQGAFPAVDIGGLWGFVNSGYSPGALAHKSATQIAGSLADPRNAIARHIDGLANLFAAAICKATHGRPVSVCSSHGVTAAKNARLR